MSEYQCFEFTAIDEPLTSRQMQELRKISTRADISTTRFWNEYDWGGLKADPLDLLKKYFDVFLHTANYSTPRFAVRVPEALIDVDGLRPYFPDGHLGTSRGFVIVDFFNEDEEPDHDAFPPELSVLTPVRDLILQGDLRPAFLSWLASAQSLVHVGADDVLPPVPAGLRSLTPALTELADLLLLDHRLLDAAKKLSAPASRPNANALRRWVEKLSAEAKTEILLRSVEKPSLRIGLELRAQFARLKEAPKEEAPRKTVAQLFESAGLGDALP